MPPRCISLLIVVAWLCVMVSLVQREVWPLLQADVPPPYTIDLVDEVRQQNQGRIIWNVYLEKNIPGEQALEDRPPPVRAETRVVPRPDDDTFVFRMQMPADPGGPCLELGLVKLKKANSSYRVNRQGQLLEMEVELGLDTILPPMKDCEVLLQGQVAEGQFVGRYRITPPRDFALLLSPELLERLQDQMEPVPMTENASVLHTLHPVSRIRGLRLGQRWRQPQVNPLEDSLSRLHVFSKGQKSRFLNAHVLPEVQLLPDWKEPIRCLVIEYDDEEAQPRTWVQEHTGLVLRQEANLTTDQRLILQRATIPRE